MVRNRSLTGVGAAVLGAIIMATLLAPHADAACPSGWGSQRGNYCYRVVSHRNWPNARDWCRGQGGDLVSTANSGENNHARNLCYDCWNGFNDRSREGRFVWSDGSSVTYTRWNGGEPNNSGGEDCTHSWGPWNDLPCGHGRRGVCKRKAACTAGKYGSGDSCQNCPAGRYSSSGGSGSMESVCSKCPAGRWGSSSGLTSSNCNGACNSGHYCPAGSTSKTAIDCPAGRYASGSGYGNSNCQGACSAGYWCGASSTSATQNKCSAGRYGHSGQKTSQCTGSCAAGYYCPAGSSTSTKNKCGNAARYCPAGSGGYSNVASGYYSTPESNAADTRTGQVQCGIGYYCSGGVRNLCPAGRYGNAAGVTSSSCNGGCAAGFFCPAGSTSSMAKTCGGDQTHPAAWFCPAGTPTRRAVRAGYYTTPLDAPESQRTGEAACGVEHYCQNGKRVDRITFSGGCSDFTHTASVDEDAEDQVVATVTATSNKVPAATLTKTLRYVSWSAGCPSNAFSMDSNGVIKNTVVLSFEACAQVVVSVDVEADDGTEASCEITIDTNDLNDAPTMGSASLSVAERSVVGTEVGVVTASDPDSGQELSFSITGGNTGDFFKIGSCSGTVTVIKAGLDAAVQSSYELAIQVKDDGPGELTAEAVAVITITNVNDPPELLDIAPLTVYENIEGGTADDLASENKQALASDPDLGDGIEVLKWAITRNDGGKFVIDSEDGTISLVTNPGLNYEQRADYSIEVTVTDLGGLSASKQYPISVLDSNDPPTINPQPLSVPELSAVDVVVGQALSTMANDQDPQTTLSFAIVSGGNGFFNINTASGQVTVAQTGLNYEDTNEYELVVSVTDDGNHPVGFGAESTEATFIVAITDVNEPPVLSSDLSFSLNENEGARAVVDTVTATDVDQGQTYFFSVNGGTGAELFTIDPSTGVVSAAVDFNFETSAASYSLDISVTDNGSPAESDSASATVAIVNVDEPPVIDFQQIQAPENLGVGANPVNKVVATDPDAGDTAALVFTLEEDSITASDFGNSTWSIEADGTLVLDRALDFETRQTYVLKVIATDPTGLSTTAPVNVDVTDVNEAPWFPYAELATSERDRSPAGHVVGQLVGADYDAGDVEQLTYSILAGNGDGYFALSATGELTMAKEAPAYNSDPAEADENLHTLIIQVEDPDGALGTGTLLVSIVDLNYSPQMPAAHSINVLEGAYEPPPAEVVVMTTEELGCTDGDGDALTYFVTDFAPADYLGDFTVKTNGNIVLSRRVNYEDLDQYLLTIVCQDVGAGKLEATTVVTVNIIDENEDPHIELNPDDFTVPENASPGTVVATITVTDPDAGDTFSLTGTASDGGSVPFTVASSTGIVTVSGALDFETTPSYTLDVIAEDSGGLTDETVVNITITNVNEPPVVADAAFDIDESTPENTRVGVRIGTVVGSDVDNAGSELVWTIESGDPDEQFEIASGGVLSVAEALDWEDRPSYTLTVRTTDPGGLYDEAFVVVTVNDLDDTSFAGFDGAVEFGTSGGDEVRITGANFGPTAAAIARGSPSPTVTATYWSEDDTETVYTATGCHVDEAGNTLILCTTAAGVGTKLDWSLVVTVGAAHAGTEVSRTITSASAGLQTTYIAPSIVGVTGAGALQTSGGQDIVIQGSNLGPADGRTLSVRYGPPSARLRYSGVSCEVTVAHTQIICGSSEGAGSGLGFSVTVGMLTSDVFDDGALSYGVPEILSVGLRDAEETGEARLSTHGGEVVRVTGVNLGAGRDTVEALTASYGPSATGYVSEGSCVAVVPHFAFDCVTAPGAGADHQWAVAVAEQHSEATTGDAMTSYRPPVLTEIGGAGAHEANTEGGQVVHLLGEMFGPPGLATVTVTYGKTWSEYTARECEVASQTLIKCTMVEGTGDGLRWQATVQGQLSNVPAQETSYHAPILFEFPTGYAGARDALTQGGQFVLLSGQHFGNAGMDTLDSVTYGPTGVEFEAQFCAVQKPHRTILCNTTEGAGDDLTWVVTVDGQESVAPTTNYGPPRIDSVVLNNGNDMMSTDGGEVVTITGENFGGDSMYLEWVRYGPSGSEYLAVDATVDSHQQITATTVPGTGGRVQWTVGIAGQDSPATDGPVFAPPVISAPVPQVAPTNGGTLITLTGTDFGLKDTATVPQVEFDGRFYIDIVQPTLLSGGPGQHQVKFILPTGTGYDRPVRLRLSANGAPPVFSNTVLFGYTPPRIDSYNPVPTNRVRQDGQVEYNLTVSGESFCANPDCGRISFDGEDLDVIHGDPRNQVGILEWHHDAVVLQVAKSDVMISVTVDGLPEPRTSAEVLYEVRLARVDALTAAGINARIFNTAGGQELTFTGTEFSETGMSVRVDSRDCEFAWGPPVVIPDTSPPEYRLRCRTPPGEGLRNVISVAIGESETFVDDDGNSMYVNFGPPDPHVAVMEATGEVVSTGGAPSAIPGAPRSDMTIHLPTVGGTVVLVGRNFGRARNDTSGAPGEDMFLTYSGGVPPFAVADPTGPRNHTAMSIAMPAGDGTALGLSRYRLDVIVGQQLPTHNIYIAYDPPVVHRVWHAAGADADAGFGGHAEGTGRLFGPTQGGGVLWFEGVDFGLPTTVPVVTVGGRACDPAGLPKNHTHLACRVAPGQGRDHGIQLTIRGQVASALVPAADGGGEASVAPLNTAFKYDYLPPRVTAISPASADTAGGTLVTIYGTSLGNVLNSEDGAAGGAASYSLAVRFDGGDDFPVQVGPSDVVQHNDTQITLVLPPGQGQNKNVVVTVSGQRNDDARPGDGSGSGSGGAAASVADVQFSFNPPRISMLEPSHGPTAGNFLVSVHGSSFGVTGAEVMIGGRPCDIETHTHDLIECTAPQGMGEMLPTVVSLPPAAASHAANFSYDPPEVFVAFPNPPDPMGTLMEIRGQNFGFEPLDQRRAQYSQLSIVVGGEPCARPTWLNDRRLTCELVHTRAGPKNISIDVAGQDYFQPAASGFLEARCAVGWYGQIGEWCLQCPRGGVCEGGYEEPYADEGWWLSPLQTPHEECPEERLHRGECPFLVPCEPNWACTGNNTCNTGYTGDRCSLCVAGKYYRLQGECIECPDNPWLIVIFFLIFAVTACAAGYVLNRKNVHLAFISIGVDYFQVLAIFARSKVRWPPLIKSIFRFMSLFNFNLELAAPECAIPDFEVTTKWFLIQALPLAAGSIFVLLHMVKVVDKRCIRGQKRNVHSHVSTMIGASLVLFYYLYLYLTRTILDVFNCAPTDPPDGKEYLEMVFEECGLEGGVQMTLLPWAIIALFGYTVGYPAFVGVTLYKNKLKVMEDQLLRAMKMGDDRVSNPHCIEFRRRYHKVYYHFKPDKWFWILCIIGRKAGIAFTALMFSKTPSFQLAMALLVMFAGYAAQVRHSPFLSPSQFEAIIAEHDAKTVLGDNDHSTVDAQLKRVLAQSRKKTRGATKLGEKGAGSAKTKSAAQAVLAALVDYNTVEQVLLACAVLVNLAGIMFESSRFESDYFETQRDIITFAVLIVIIGSLVYFTAVFASEVLGTCAPALLKKLTAKKQARAQEELKLKRQSMLGGSSGRNFELHGMGLTNPMGATGARGGGEPVQMGGGGGVNTNPMLTAQLSSRGGAMKGPAASGGEYDDQDRDALVDMIKTLKGSNQELKKALAAASVSVARGPGARRSANRTEFTPRLPGGKAASSPSKSSESKAAPADPPAAPAASPPPPPPPAAGASSAPTGDAGGEDGASVEKKKVRRKVKKKGHRKSTIDGAPAADE